MASTKKNDTWVGEAELVSILETLKGQGDPLPQELIKRVTTAAVKFQGEYKMVVFEVEKFIKRAVPSDKLSGMTVIEAICRTAQGKEKDLFCARFGLRMKQICACLHDIPSSDKIKLSKLIEGWRKRNLFASTALPEESEFLTSDTTSEGKDVSSASGESTESKQTGPTKRKSIKLCPFREGNCPFEKCRFSHDQSSAWIETIPKKTKKRPNTSIAEGHSLNIFGLATERVMPSAKEIMQPTFLLGDYPVRREESNAAPELHKFQRIKLNCERSMGNASFTVVDSALFERLL